MSRQMPKWQVYPIATVLLVAILAIPITVAWNMATERARHEVVTTVRMVAGLPTCTYGFRLVYVQAHHYGRKHVAVCEAIQTRVAPNGAVLVVYP